MVGSIPKSPFENGDSHLWRFNTCLHFLAATINKKPTAVLYMTAIFTYTRRLYLPIPHGQLANKLKSISPIPIGKSVRCL